MKSKINKPAQPFPEPLSGSVHGSFAYRTVTERMPRIARETLAENDFTSQVSGELEDLIQDLQTGRIDPETKALLNVSPRNVFLAWEMATLAGTKKHVQPTPPEITDLSQ